MSRTCLSLNIRPRLKLTLTRNGLPIGPEGKSAYEVAVINGFVGTVEEWFETLKMTMGSGEKKTGIDAGTYKQMSVSDDYLYICVVPGEAGVAVWKKTLLFQT